MANSTSKLAIIREGVADLGTIPTPWLVAKANNKSLNGAKVDMRKVLQKHLCCIFLQV